MIRSWQVFIMIIIENSSSGEDTPLHFSFTNILCYIVLSNWGTGIKLHFRIMWLLIIVETLPFGVPIVHINSPLFVIFCLIIFVHYHCCFFRIYYVKFSLNYIIKRRGGGSSFLNEFGSENVSFFSKSLGRAMLR